MRTGRYRRGASNPSSKLDEPMVRVIRDSKEKGVALAAQFQISPAAVCRIRKRIDWRHIA